VSVTFVDVHTHIFPPEIIAERDCFFKNEPGFSSIYANFSAHMVDGSGLVQAMDKGGIDISWVLGFPWIGIENARRHNNYLVQAVADSKGRLRGLACVHPQMKWSLSEAERSFSLGLSGLGELAFYGSDLMLDSLTPLCCLCAEANKPLLLHTNEPVGHYYSGKTPMTLNALYTLIKMHPMTKLVLAHMAGGLFFYSLLKKEIASFLTNVWLDSAAVPFLYKPQIYRFATDLLGVDKILLGTDYPLLNVERYCRELVLPEVSLSSDDLKMIMGGTAKTIIP